MAMKKSSVISTILFGLCLAITGCNSARADNQSGGNNGEKDKISERTKEARQQRQDRSPGQNKSERAGKVTELSYGNAPLQKLDYWRPDQKNAPLVLFVHGGGWHRGDKKAEQRNFKADHYLSQGYAFASINYRLLPEATVENQAADIASAIAFLVKDAGKYGFDKRRIVLMGHSAGAHLSALVGTDGQYLSAAGLDLSILTGVIPLDGAAYDVPSQMGENPRLMGDTYKAAFGTDPVRQKSLSPYWHASMPNAPAFLILHVQRPDAKRQSEMLANALQKAGTPATLKAFSGRGLKGHAEINRQMGNPDYPATAAVDTWLKERFQ